MRIIKHLNRDLNEVYGSHRITKNKSISGRGTSKCKTLLIAVILVFSEIENGSMWFKERE